jgi:hypothetical protein
MLSIFKLQTLKQKLWAIVATSFVARVVMFFVLPSTPTSLAPDEATYSALTKWIAESKSADQFPTFGQSLYLSGRSIVLPASIFYRIGLNELDAVRIVSTMYSLLALILVAKLVLKLHRENASNSEHAKFNENLIIGLFLIYAFLPSHFIWSNLALRESSTEFWILATFVLFFLIYHYQIKVRALGVLFLIASIFFAFSSRPQVGWVIVVSLLFYLFLNLKQKRTYLMIAVVSCGFLLGSALSTPSSTKTKNISEILSPITNVGELVTSKQLGNQVGAASVIEPPSCPNETSTLTPTPPTKVDTYFCIAWRAPYMVSTFLFRPILGVDVTSTSSLIAAIENIFWFLLFVTLAALLVKRRVMSFAKPILPALIFFVLYVLGASAYQGNMGTGFRHKSLILWVVLLALFALAWRKTETPEQNSRNNSQESAV